VPFVVDCSVTACWYIEGQATVYADSVLAALETEVAYAPALWRLEMANLVLKLERRKHLTPKEAEAVIEHAAKLPIVVHEELFGLKDVHRFGRTQMLSSYDASYLLLAMRLSVEVATHDAAMIAACERLSIPIFRR
jgi:predicted nucleic acid-binding protein